jgi:hypothetical protein
MADEETSVPANLARITEMEEHVFGLPFFAATSDGEVPDEVFENPMAYVLTGNGLMLVKNGTIFSSASMVKEVIGLGEVPEKLIYRFTKIPESIVTQVAAFFYWASPNEAMVLPYYNTDTGEWMVLVPEQSVTGGSIDYKLTEEQMASIPEGFVRIGSWHSHGSGSAYHSSIDHHDEESDDGVHITFGSFGTYAKDFTSSVSLMADGARWIIESGKAFDIEEGLLRIQSSPAAVHGSGSWKTYSQPTRKEWIEYSKEQRDSWTVSDEWKAQVKKVVVQTTWVSGSSYMHGTQGTWLEGSYPGGSVNGSSGSSAPRVPIANSLHLCPSIGGCGSCKKAISLFSVTSVIKGRSVLFTQAEREALNLNTEEGRLRAIREFLSRLGGKGTNTTCPPYKDFPLDLTEEQLDEGAIKIGRFLYNVGEENLTDNFPRVNSGDPDNVCLDPDSLMYAKPVSSGFFCLRLQPKEYSKAVTEGLTTEAGYVDFGRCEEYQVYARSNGQSFYSKLPNGYVTCADCDHCVEDYGCIMDDSPYAGLVASPTGCDDLPDEMRCFPVCIEFTESEFDKEGDYKELCGSCVYLDIDDHGIEVWCLRTNDATMLTSSCLSYKKELRLDRGSEDTSPGQLVLSNDAGDGSIASISRRCYTCSNELEDQTCLIFQGNVGDDGVGCPYYTKMNMIEG